MLEGRTEKGRERCRMTSVLREVAGEGSIGNETDASDKTTRKTSTTARTHLHIRSILIDLILSVPKDVPSDLILSLILQIHRSTVLRVDSMLLRRFLSVGRLEILGVVGSRKVLGDGSDLDLDAGGEKSGRGGSQ